MNPWRKKQSEGVKRLIVWREDLERLMGNSYAENKIGAVTVRKPIFLGLTKKASTYHLPRAEIEKVLLLK